MKKRMVVEDLEDNLLFILPKHRDDLLYSECRTHCYIYTCEKAVLPSNTLCQHLYFTSLL